MKRYSHPDMHERLCDTALSEQFHAVDEIGAQALFCPYYVPLEGKLGADWGVIVNPESSRFGMLTFEHDDCGCPPDDDEDEWGWGRHGSDPSQDGDTWWEGWAHRCDDDCDDPCEWTT